MREGSRDYEPMIIADDLYSKLGVPTLVELVVKAIIELDLEETDTIGDLLITLRQRERNHE